MLQLQRAQQLELSRRDLNPQLSDDHFFVASVNGIRPCAILIRLSMAKPKGPKYLTKVS